MIIRCFRVTEVFFYGALALITGVAGLAGGAVTAVQAQGATTPGASGLPLPRFVSLKSDKVNVRVGPSRQNALVWTYQHKGLPVEIIYEFDNWRKIRDSNGETGWVLSALLAGTRTAMVMTWNKEDISSDGKKVAALEKLYKRPDETAAIVAQVESGVIGRVKTCDGQWCRLEMKGYSGWMKQQLLWGVYPGEKIK